MMSKKPFITRRKSINLLLAIIIILVAMYYPLLHSSWIIAAPPMVKVQVFSVYVGMVLIFALLSMIIALREACSILENGREERIRFMNEMLQSITAESEKSKFDPPART